MTVGAGWRLPVAALALSVAACAPATPRLTNPPRQDAARGPDAPAVRGHVVDAFVGDRKYDGVLQLPLAEDWQHALPDEGRWAISRLELGPAYVSGHEVWIGSSRSNGIDVLDRRSGRRIRRVETLGPVQCPPLDVGDDRVVVDTFGLVRREGPDGTVRWTWKAPAGVFRTPVLSGDALLLALGNDTVAALAVDTGDVRWLQRRTVARASTELAILGAPAPTVHNEEVLVGFSDGMMVAFGLADGAERWRHEVGAGKFSDIQTEAVVVADLVVTAAFGGPMVALSALEHTERWRLDDVGAVASIARRDGDLYAADGRGRLVAVDARTGSIRWTWELTDTQLGAPVATDEVVFIGDVSGTLYAIDRSTGLERWRFRPLDGTRLAGVVAPAVLVGRQLLVPSAGGRLYSLIGATNVGEALNEVPSQRPDRPLGW